MTLNSANSADFITSMNEYGRDECVALHRYEPRELGTGNSLIPAVFEDW